jgi:hypothetical protein
MKKRDSYNGGKKMRRVEDNSQKTKRTIQILIGVVAFLLVFIAFFFVVKPQVNKFVYAKQMEGANFAVANIIGGVQANGYVEIPVSANQSLVLVPYVPEQQQVQQVAQQIEEQ